MSRLRYLLVLLVTMPFLFSFLKNEKATSTKESVVSLVQTPPDTLSWRLLGRIKFITKPDPDFGEVEWPVINTELKSLNKQRVVMSGFIVPIDNETYALSKNTFSACFFCGKAGPETIMGIKWLKPSGRIKTDTYVSLEGNLRVNATDVNDWIYHIEDAVIVARD